MVSQLPIGQDPRRLAEGSYARKNARLAGVWKFHRFLKKALKNSFAYGESSSMDLFLFATYLAAAKNSSPGASRRTHMLARVTL